MIIKRALLAFNSFNEKKILPSLFF